MKRWQCRILFIFRWVQCIFECILNLYLCFFTLCIHTHISNCYSRSVTVFVLPHPLDPSTIWSYPSSSSPVPQAGTAACCSSSQKQAEVLLFSWLVRHCLESTVFNHPTPPRRAAWLWVVLLCSLHCGRDESDRIKGIRAKDQIMSAFGFKSFLVVMFGDARYSWLRGTDWDSCQHSPSCLWIRHRCPQLADEKWLRLFVPEPE